MHSTYSLLEIGEETNHLIMVTLLFKIFAPAHIQGPHSFRWFHILLCCHKLIIIVLFCRQKKKVGDSSRIQTLLSSLIDFRKGWKTVPPAIFQQLNYQQNLHPSQTRSWLHLRACLDGLQTLPCLRLRRRASVAIRTSARVPDFWRATSQNVDAEWMQHATSPVIKQTATWTTAACQTCGRHPNTP